MATHSSIPAWKIPQRDLVGYIVHDITNSMTRLSKQKQKKQAICQYSFIDSNNADGEC